ncbi:MAG: hypothetical protein ACO1OB_20770 [Archangium sp.]
MSSPHEMGGGDGGAGHVLVVPVGRTVNFDGSELTFIDSTRTRRFNVIVFAWTDADGTRECDLDCRPEPGDTVVTLTGRNWPWLYQINFNP